jgi:hypothetical protein
MRLREEEDVSRGGLRAGLVQLDLDAARDEEEAVARAEEAPDLSIQPGIASGGDGDDLEAIGGQGLARPAGHTSAGEAAMVGQGKNHGKGGRQLRPPPVNG